MMASTKPFNPLLSTLEDPDLYRNITDQVKLELLAAAGQAFMRLPILLQDYQPSADYLYQTFRFDSGNQHYNLDRELDKELSLAGFETEHGAIVHLHNVPPELKNNAYGSDAVLYSKGQFVVMCLTAVDNKTHRKYIEVRLLQQVSRKPPAPLSGRVVANAAPTPTKEKPMKDLMLYKSEAFGLGETPFEMFKCKDDESVRDKITQNTGMPGSNIEANVWLPFAAKEYKISGDIRDYVLVPVPIMFSDIPNTNGDSISMAELLRFNPELGMQAFKTFRGKPAHLEHDNQDITKAKGVILDVFLRPLRGFGNGRYYKLVELLAFDRTKDPILCDAILKGEINSYSLGFYFKAYNCSVCGRLFGQGGSQRPCSHTAPKRPVYRQPDGRLAYRRCVDITGFETSAVANPAYVTAISPHVMDLKRF